MDIAPLQERRVKASDLPLDRLASSSQVSEREKVAAASTAFEALLLRQVLEESQRPLIPSKYVSDSTSNGIYRDLVVEQLAQSIAKSHSLGLAQSLTSGLERQLGRAAKAAAPGGQEAVGEPKAAALRSPKDAAAHLGAPPPQGPVAAAAAAPASEPLLAGGGPVAGPFGGRPLTSPKMKDLSERQGRAPLAVGTKNTHHD
jgi:Rod binding domain-containing protein